MVIHCLFEQSGTFKNEFRKLGYTAYDYDILNDFNETDYIIDLFAEINNAYDGKPSIFDHIQKDDLVLAFFPCIRFEDQIQLYFRGKACGQKKWKQEKKLEYCLKLHEELHNLYTIITKLSLVSIRGGLRLIIENPYSTQHYLTRYWCIDPSIIDTDRHKSGDYYRKPTQYFFVNTEPKNNIIDEPIIIKPRTNWQKPTTDRNEYNRKVQRSLISNDYVRRFIKTYLID